jgi:hypothetical protein
MQRYIEQLIADIHKATWQIRPPHEIWDDTDLNSELECEDMAYVEKYIYGDKEPISSITGIDTEMLPAPDKLTQDQQALLAVELEKLLQQFCFYLDFPENYPSKLRYPFIRNFWDSEEVALSFGENHIEFCDFEEENCPFPRYCNTCKEVAEQMEFDNKLEENRGKDDLSDDELPF